MLPGHLRRKRNLRMADISSESDTRLIEAGFPCHQVGAETQRERGASSALPPLYYLHVWWARRPLTPSRAAILASLLPADADPDWFLRQLGIEKSEALVNGGTPWVLNPNDNTLLTRLEEAEGGTSCLVVDSLVVRRLEAERNRREKCRKTIQKLVAADSSMKENPVVVRWGEASRPLPEPLPEEGERIEVRRVPADPAHVKDRIAFAKSEAVKKILGKELKWDEEDLYGYPRAFMSHPKPSDDPKVILDPTAGGGSIPFEALRLGHKVIANDLNPVASVILHATLDYPARFGPELAKDIEKWGERLGRHVEKEMADVTPFSPLPESERKALREHCRKCPEMVEKFDLPEFDQVGLLFCRQITCPHCKGTAPLLNSSWLSKTGAQWGVSIVPDSRGKDVRFETYRVEKGKGPKGENPDFATVVRGVGACVHCKQAISGDEIKRQARGESEHGRWTDRLFCVVAVRYQPKLDKKGQLQFYKSGVREGEIKTEKVTFFRPPNETDLAALEKAAERLREKWDEWDAAGLIPTEKIPPGHRRDERDIIVQYGITRWLDMFTPRQLLGHLTLVEEFNRQKEALKAELPKDRARAVATYLQFMIDKGLDYNSKHTRWEYTRGVIKGTFGRHDFSLKWTFGEMIFSGDSSGFKWCISQVLDAFEGISHLACPSGKPAKPSIQITSGTSAHLSNLEEESVDLVCMDPPYYNNVQYAELSDFFYVWNKRTLGDLYPDLFRRRMTNKELEAVANPARDGSKDSAKTTYEKMMGEIFLECRRVLKANGLLTLMFNHKSQDAWETFTRSLIETGWTITASFPVESETAHGSHTMDRASAASSIFITCRKRQTETADPAPWLGFGGTGVQRKIAAAVAEALPEFENLRLNPVDKMVASYGRALRVLSENWPVIDGDDPVSPARAMNEASRIVSEREIARITNGRLKVTDLSAEAAMALTLYGMYGLKEFSYDEGLNLSRSLNIRLDERPAGYTPSAGMIGINTDANPRGTTRQEAERVGFHAPLLRKGSKLRLARPEERHNTRLEDPKTEWDALCGLIMAHRRGDIPVARGYLQNHEAHAKHLLDLLEVWTAETDDEDLAKEGRAMLFGLKQS